MSTLLPINTDTGWNLSHTYSSLPGAFFVPATPMAASKPQLVIFNHALARELGLAVENTSENELAELFGGKVLPPGAQPIAQAYAGHQFGHFTMLGDGRAILLGEQVTPKGERFDIQFKGSGQTPFSRRGDGKAALSPMLREYIISEAMHALGIPTTRSLAVVATGEPVYRENVLPGAILTRVAASHIRVGTFEYAAAVASQEGKLEILQALADYTIARHYPEIGPREDRYIAFFDAVAERQAQLIARWQCVGFIHGVMNTDNMALSGETIDYGPCAFMDAFDPATVFSSIDQHGRYAFGNQPSIAAWNLARFAETLLVLFADDEKEAIAVGQAALARFNERFNQHYHRGMLAKLGLQSERAGDVELVSELLALMQQYAADYTNTFRRLSYVASGAVGASLDTAHAALAMEFHSPNGKIAPSAMEIHSELWKSIAEMDTYYAGTANLFAAPDFHSWVQKWLARLAYESLSLSEIVGKMRCVTPAVIPRNHKVEEALAAATSGDLTPMLALLDALRSPYQESLQNLAYRAPAPPSPVPYRTFCGT